MTDINPLTHHRCYSCREVKPLSDYYRSSRKAGGHQGFCKLCQKARKRRDNEALRETDIDAFRERNRVAAAKFRESHREHYREYQKLYQRAYYARKRAEKLAAQQPPTP